MGQAITRLKRSEITESSHVVKVLISDINNKVLFSSGNDNDYIFPRSSIKIFQAIPFIKTNAVNHFKLSKKQIALACSSHRGENYHMNELNDWIKKIGIDKKKLQCGIHNPLNSKASESLLRSNKQANQLHNNCAGKHLAMITSCLVKNYKQKNYLEFYHPHQIAIREIFEKFSNSKINKKCFTVDGCSAPQYCFKMKEISEMLINLIKSYKGKFYNSNEIKILINSVVSNPKYIGGSDSFDSNIMMISNKRIFCKGGAEGVFLFANLRTGIAGIFKVSDGNERAIPPIILDIFSRFKIMNTKELKILNKKYNLTLKNHAKKVIGSMDIKI